MKAGWPLLFILRPSACVLPPSSLLFIDQTRASLVGRVLRASFGGRGRLARFPTADTLGAVEPAAETRRTCCIGHPPPEERGPADAVGQGTGSITQGACRCKGGVGVQVEKGERHRVECGFGVSGTT